MDNWVDVELGLVRHPVSNTHTHTHTHIHTHTCCLLYKIRRGLFIKRLIERKIKIGKAFTLQVSFFFFFFIFFVCLSTRELCTNLIAIHRGLRLLLATETRFTPANQLGGTIFLTQPLINETTINEMFLAVERMRLFGFVLWLLIGERRKQKHDVLTLEGV